MRILAAGLLVSSWILAGAVWAGPIVQVKGGQTTLTLSDEFVDLLDGCEIRRIKPTVVKPGGELLRFTVAGGVIDFDGMVGELDHKGGISISCYGGSTEVSLRNFTVDTMGDTPVITAMAAVDGSLQERLSLFVPTGEPEVTLSNWNRLKLGKVELLLAEEAAMFLNTHLGIPTPLEGPIGEADSKINLRLDDKDRDEDNDDDEEFEDDSKDKKDKVKKDKDEEEEEEEDEDEEEEEEEDEED